MEDKIIKSGMFVRFDVVTGKWMEDKEENSVVSIDIDVR
jgi:hypothetical protein